MVENTFSVTSVDLHSIGDQTIRNDEGILAQQTVACEDVTLGSSVCAQCCEFIKIQGLGH